jgi:flagellar biosynthesis/type III secretory pathway protein FliH
MVKCARSPAKRRYDEQHPVISFRVTEQAYERLKDVLVKQNKSIGTFFREALEIEQRNYAEARRRAYEQGFKEAKEKYAVAVTCISCYDGFYISSEELKDEAGLMLSNKYAMVHEDCEVPADDDPSRVWRSKVKRGR